VTRRSAIIVGLVAILLTLLVIVGYAYNITLWGSLRLLIVPATIAGSLALYAGLRRSIEAQGRAAERVVEAEKRVETAPEQAKPAWDLARATLDQYFQRNLAQIRAIFWLSVVVMLVGFAVICFGVLRAFQSPAALLPATIASLAGVITEFIGGHFSLHLSFRHTASSRLFKISRAHKFRRNGNANIGYHAYHPRSRHARRLEE
jgi:hypothetical protein